MSAGSGDQLSALIGMIYEAAADLSLWPQLLENMSAYLESYPELGSSSGQKMNFLVPHFERAHAIHQQLSEVTEERNLLESVMNRLPLGAAIIDGKCNAISMNRAMVAQLQGNTLLGLLEGKLVAFESAVLAEAVSNIMLGNGSDGLIRIGEGGSALAIWIGRGLVGSSESCSRLMVLIASRTSQALSEHGLIALFGLTPAEARLTQKVALGCTLEESAALLGIARNTAKTHLARVFTKVGVKRQIDLMQAIYASPLWLQDKAAGGMSVSLSCEGQRLRLSDGRWLYFSDSGDPQGHPVILMHGIAGSRNLRHPDDGILLREGVRLIIPERPGSGDSDILADRAISDWPKDIAELSDHLGLQSFTVLGYSAGTAYAFAVAAAFPDRVSSVHIVAALPPIDGLEDLRAYNPVFRMTLFLAKYTPALLPALMRVMVKDIRKNVFYYLETLLQDAPEQDREVLAHPKLRANIATGMRASVRCGEHEIAQEVLLVARNWNIDLSGLSVPVSVWHGERDPLVSIDGARKLVSLLPGAKLFSIPDAGHYLLYSHWQALLRSISNTA